MIEQIQYKMGLQKVRYSMKFDDEIHPSRLRDTCNNQLCDVVKVNWWGDP